MLASTAAGLSAEVTPLRARGSILSLVLDLLPILVEFAFRVKIRAVVKIVTL